MVCFAHGTYVLPDFEHSSNVFFLYDEGIDFLSLLI